MKRKIETGVMMLCTLLLSGGAAHAQIICGKTCNFALGIEDPVVPEVDFGSAGSVGVGTLLMVLGYTVRKGVQKITDRNRD